MAQQIPPPSSQGIALWSEEELLTFDLAKSKMGTIENQIDQNLSKLIHSSQFQSKYPALHGELSREFKPVQLRSDLSEIAGGTETLRQLFEEEKDFVSQTATVVIMAAQAFLPPPQVRATGDNPLMVGMALSTYVRQREVAKLLEQRISTDEWGRESLAAVQEDLSLRRTFREARDEEGRYAAARNIINQGLEKVPPSLRLAALRVASRHSHEFSAYFKTVAMNLAKQIKLYNKEEAVAAEECAIS